MTFSSENELLDTTIQTGFLDTLIEEDAIENYIALEPKGLFGIPDVVVINVKNGNGTSKKKTIAFELKLSKWKRALVQAFKYRAFADLSYVLIDEGHSKPAINNIESFRKANIGLLSIDVQGNVKSYFEPTPEEPYSEYYESIVLEKVMNSAMHKNANTCCVCSSSSEQERYGVKEE